MRDLLLVLDCETCTLPLTQGADESNQAFAKRKQDFALKNPLIYNIAWKLVTRKNEVIQTRNFMVQETFFTPSVFNTAYYKDKRPFYIDQIQRKQIEVENWEVISNLLAQDLAECTYACAYNAEFDFVKAIPFTEEYHRKMFSNQFDSWIEWKTTPRKTTPYKKSAESKPQVTEVSHRGAIVPIVDIWNMACDNLMNTRRYKKFCLENDFYNTALFFKSSAEICYRYLTQDVDFIENHTAMEDVNIEIDILLACLKKTKPTVGLEFMPCRKLGSPYEIVQEVKAYHVHKASIQEKLEIARDKTTSQAYANRMQKLIDTL